MASLAFTAPRGAFTDAMAHNAEIARDAAAAAMADTVAQVKRDGRANIASAGFGPRWQNTLRVNVYPAKQRTVDVAAYVYHKIPYAGVFETGATIPGSPFLWLPLPAAPKKAGRRRVTAANYREVIGAPLFRINRPGKAPLLAAMVPAAVAARGRSPTAAQLRAGRRAQARGAFSRRRRSNPTVALPLYVGIRSVRIPKKFDLASVFERGANTLQTAYARYLGEFDGR